MEYFQTNSYLINLEVVYEVVTKENTESGGTNKRGD
jgi:hypothetical protein